MYQGTSCLLHTRLATYIPNMLSPSQDAATFRKTQRPTTAPSSASRKGLTTGRLGHCKLLSNINITHNETDTRVLIDIEKSHSDTLDSLNLIVKLVGCVVQSLQRFCTSSTFFWSTARGVKSRARSVIRALRIFGFVQAGPLCGAILWPEVEG